MGSSGGRAAPGRADGDPVRFDATPRSIDDLRPGDLIFVRAERTPLGAIIGELDGCAFSHVGVLDRGSVPTLLSARTDRHGSTASPDLGGVRRNALEDLVDRGLYAAPLGLPDATRERGLDRLAEWVEVDAGPDRESRSRFSYAKLVVVSAALASVRRRRPLGIDAAQALWDATVEAASTLRWLGAQPAFYCAEAIAAAYDLEYGHDALWVRDGEPHPVGVGPWDIAPPGVAPAPPAVDLRPHHRPWVDRVPPPRELRRRARAAWGAIGALGFTTQQGRAVVRLLVILWRYDPILAERLVEAAREMKEPPAPGAPAHDPAPLPPGAFVPPPFVQGVADPLPTALVTPRMLLSDRVVTSVHLLKL